MTHYTSTTPTMFGVAAAGPFPSSTRRTSTTRRAGLRIPFFGNDNAEASSSTSTSNDINTPTLTRRESTPTTIFTSSTRPAPILIPLRRASSALPDYISITHNSALDTPSYDEALASGRRMSMLGQSVEAHDYFGQSSVARHESVVEEEEDEDDPLRPRASRPPPSLNLIPLPPRALPIPEPTTTTDLPPQHDLPLDLPPPPASALPPYSPHLAFNELRLISTLHQEQSHPSAQFFSQLSSQLFSGRPVEEDLGDGREEETGGKKLKVAIRKGAVRMNGNGMGPLMLRMGREGFVEGTVEVGKVDGAVGLEVSIMGIVNTSYYIRGQYTLLDTLPLARSLVKLWPIDDTTEEPVASASVEPISPTHTLTADEILRNGTFTPATAANASEKDYFPQGQVFPFKLAMPTSHYREGEVELPPSCQIFQVGMQAGIEYVLRVKLVRKKWRLNESIAIPIMYEPRAYLSPRRLRALTSNDPLNPGWRTIRLRGGNPSKTPQPGPNTGVEVTFLLPSPPILFINATTDLPPIPFHLHFHSSLPLPLSTFSDPRQCKFVIRFMRVANIRIGSEKEIRRVEVPSICEIWQEGGERIRLGEISDFVRKIEAGGVVDGNGASGSGSGSGDSNGVTSPTSPTERKRSFASRRPSFLKRRGSSSTAVATTSTSTSTPTETPQINRTTSNLPPPTIPEVESPPLLPPTALLPLDATDVHLLGEIRINVGTQLHRTLVQSFSTPEIAVNYVVEVGLQPHAGAVREAFDHVWGGGVVEVVLGRI